MKKTALFFFLIAPFLCPAISVYHIKYNFKGSESVIYEAFLVRNDDAGGTVRIRFQDGNTGSAALVKMDFTEEYVQQEEYLLFKGKNPVYLKGSGEYNPDYFWFRKNGKVYSSHAVSSPGSDGSTTYGSIISVTLLDMAKLEKSFVLNFFDKDDPFYQNLFAEVETGNTANTSQGKMHFILASDTWDKTIGTSCQVSENLLYNYFQQIASQAGLSFNSKIIHDGNFTRANVLNAINNVHPGKNDVVVFYYDGHGFRTTSDDADPYPRIDIRTNDFDAILPNSLSLSWIYNTIKDKGGRLNLVIGDCCNSYISLPRFLSYGSGMTERSLNTLSANNCMQLFKYSKANIIATAATSGQYALGSSQDGGIFTKAFISSLDYQLSTFNSNPTWPALMQTTKSKTATYSANANCSEPPCRFDPVYFIDNGGSTNPGPVTTPQPQAKPSSKIDKVWVDHNVYENGVIGMRIHTRFYIYNYKGKSGNCVAYFFFENGTALKDFNNNYHTSDGKVSVGTAFTPNYENALFNDYQLFIPYSELHMDPGHYNLKFKVEVHRGDVSSGYNLNTSAWQYFTYDG